MEAASRAFHSRFQLGSRGARSLPAQDQQRCDHPRAICFSVVNDTGEELVVSVTRRDDAAVVTSLVPPGRCTFITEPSSFEEHRSQLLRLGEQQLFELRFAENNGYHFVEVEDPEAALSQRYSIVQEEPRQVLQCALYLRCHVVRAYGRGLD